MLGRVGFNELFEPYGGKQGTLRLERVSRRVQSLRGVNARSKRTIGRRRTKKFATREWAAKQRSPRTAIDNLCKRWSLVAAEVTFTWPKVPTLSRKVKKETIRGLSAPKKRPKAGASTSVCAPLSAPAGPAEFHIR